MRPFRPVAALSAFRIVARTPATDTFYPPSSTATPPRRSTLPPPSQPARGRTKAGERLRSDAPRWIGWGGRCRRIRAPRKARPGQTDRLRKSLGTSDRFRIVVWACRLMTAMCWDGKRGRGGLEGEIEGPGLCVTLEGASGSATAVARCCVSSGLAVRGFSGVSAAASSGGHFVHSLLALLP